MSKTDKIFGWYLSKMIYEWNPFKIKRKHHFYKQFIQPDDLCFDVGAHMGDRVSSWLGLGAKVVAFEPQIRFYEYLKKKFKNRSFFYLEKVGLSNVEGSMNFNICNKYPTLSSLSGKEWEDQLNENSKLNIKFDTKEEIEVSTLDHMIEKYGVPKFIKIDVEGHEREVLLGLSQQVDYLSFEFLSFNKEELQACMDICASLGYSQFNWSYQEEFTLRNREWLTKDRVYKDIEIMEKNVFSGDVYVKA